MTKGFTEQCSLTPFTACICFRRISLVFHSFFSFPFFIGSNICCHSISLLSHELFLLPILYRVENKRKKTRPQKSKGERMDCRGTENECHVSGEEADSVT